jgi:hypothetical protein
MMLNNNANNAKLQFVLRISTSQSAFIFQNKQQTFHNFNQFQLSEAGILFFSV